MLGCQRNRAALFDRGGQRKIGDFELLSRVKWERRRDDITTAQIWSPAKDNPGCEELFEMADAGRTELVIYRGEQRVWEGPVMRCAWSREGLELEAKDIMQYVNRLDMRGEYDNRYPNVGTVLDRIKRIIDAELSRKEALDPPINVMPHIRYLYATAPAKDARTASHTLPYEMEVFEHIDTFAARGGLDYTVVGRSILFFDVHHKIGQTPMVTENDFSDGVIVTQYGSELTTRVTMTDGKGHFGHSSGSGVDPHYGIWEVTHQAYDENEGGDPADDQAPPSVQELESQANRAYSQGKLPPLVVRVPDNTTLNPDTKLTIADLVPGVFIPLTANLPGKKVSQMQKLDSMSVEETSKGEQIKVTLSPAYTEAVDPEE